MKGLFILNEFKMRRSRGQAFVELVLVMIVMLLIVFGALQIAKMVSQTQEMASVAREVGRQLASGQYNTNDVPKVLEVATNMISTGGFETNGKIIISFIRRVSGTDTDNDDVSNTNDVLRIQHQFIFPSTNAPDWDSRLTTIPITNGIGKYHVWPDKIGDIHVYMLPLTGSYLAYVEVFYTNVMPQAIRNLGVNADPFIYEKCAF